MRRLEASNRFRAPSWRTLWRTRCIRSSVFLLLALWPLAAAGQMLPPPPGGDVLLAEGEVAGLAGGSYARFEIKLFESPDGSNAMDFSIPGSWSEILVSSFLPLGSGETPGPELRIDASRWQAMALLVAAMEPYMEVDFDTLSSAEEAALADFIDNLLGSEALVALAVSGDTKDMLAELTEALVTHGIQALLGAQGAACPKDLAKTMVQMVKAFASQLSLIDDIVTSKATCRNPIPHPAVRILTRVLCVTEIVLWVDSVFRTGVAMKLLAATVPHVIAFQDGILADRVGFDMTASQARSQQIAREAKLFEESAVGVDYELASAAAATTVLAAVALSAIDLEVATAALDVANELGGVRTTWASTLGCVRSVMSPRFQASTVRNRLYVHTANGLVPLPVSGGNVLTALPRALAKHQVIEIDANDLYALDPNLIPEFDEASQRQDLVVMVCEGVVLESDPEPLGLGYPNERWQNPGTDFWIGDLGAGGSCLNLWWLGLSPDRTDVVRPWHAASLHRACESTGLIDNNNDSVADASAEEHCVINPVEPGEPGQPWNDLEEDLYWVPVDTDIPGQTHWSQLGVDMLCNAGTLSLVSSSGLQQRSVRQEFVTSTASCWTNELNGNRIDNHPHAATQIRFALSDSNWGEPYPKGCYTFDSTTSKWTCSGSPGCSCSSGGGVAPPPFP
ncbi:MAG: hypothetical protein AAF560_25845 [Acidobacteriota bacterium]